MVFFDLWHTTIFICLRVDQALGHHGRGNTHKLSRMLDNPVLDGNTHKLCGFGATNDDSTLSFGSCFLFDSCVIMEAVFFLRLP